MIRLGNGVYLCEVAGNKVKVVYMGRNICEIFINDELRGRAPFDYVKKQILKWEKREPLSTAYIGHYQFKELVPIIDISV
ncbi:hypothetical protein LCY76_17085 [Fictibacillus sp. KIGAM418]|uniref:Uncharacterized protein n=1 Tax=Fictibacillus marinisediminis TaxID=2878389 RepID=A0A9X1XEC4_9BACL|nr:hypothetical protein [Fictibacillus marinisediminis]MCK6258290.1 hypothetical protein [Fictibacillus marinisediminis]